MARNKAKAFDRSKVDAAARRARHFANGGTARSWAMSVGAGVHGRGKSKAAQSRKACRGCIIH